MQVQSRKLSCLKKYNQILFLNASRLTGSKESKYNINLALRHCHIQIYKAANH